MQRTNNHVHVKDPISGKRRPLPGCLSKKDSVFFWGGVRLKHFQFRLVEGSESLGIARHSCENSTMMFRIATVWNSTSIMDLQLSACFGFSFSIHNT